MTRTIRSAMLVVIALCHPAAVRAAYVLSDVAGTTSPLRADDAQADSADPENLLSSADKALQGGRLIEAEGLLNRYEEREPKSAPARARDMATLLRAELMLATGHPAEALVELRSNDVAAVQGCRATAAEGTALLLLDRLSAASIALQSHTTECGRDPVYWRARGRLDLALGRPVAAVAALRKAVDEAPEDRALRNDLGVALIAADLPGEAIALLSALVGESPDQTEAQVNLDYARGMLGRVPVRGSGDSDIFWSRRLQFAGGGARQAGRNTLAEALLGQAVIERPRYDAQLWRQYSELSGK